MKPAVQGVFRRFRADDAQGARAENQNGKKKEQHPVPRPGDVDRQVLSGDFAGHLFHGRLLELC